MINWQEYPFTKLLFPFVTGIALAIYFETGNLFLLGGIFIVLTIVALILFRIRGNVKVNYAFSVIVLIAFLILGYTWTLLRNELVHPAHFQQHLTEEIQPILGVIADMPVKKGKRIKFVLKLKEIRLADNSVAANGNILLYVPIDSLSKKLAYGDQIGVAGIPRSISPPTNPYAFDYQSYLHFKNIHHQLFVKEGHWRILGKNEGNPILKTAFQLRKNFIETLRKYLKNDNQFSVGSALILGYKDEITDEIRTAYAGTGAMHVLAVSGLHVGLVFLILNTLLKVFNSNKIGWRVLRVTLLLSGIWAFAILTGASPSVLRAGTMFTFVTIGISLKQPTNIYNTLAGSAVFLLAYEPLLLMNVGFQMSYLAVIGIVYFQPKIAERWLIKNRIGNYLWQLVAVSFAAQLMTLPLSLYYFHQFPCYFWLSGLIVVPAAGVILSAGILLFIFEAISPILGVPFGWFLDALIAVVNWCIFLIEQFPFSVIRGIWVSGFLAFLLYLIIFSLIGLFNTYRWKWIMVGSGIFAFASLISAFRGFQKIGNQQIIVYDVYKNSLIDFVNGRDCYTLQNEDISEKTVSFAAQNNRWEMGIEHFEMVNFSEDSLHIFNNWRFKEGRIQFFNQDFAIIDRSLVDDFLSIKITVTHLLIRNTPYLKMGDLLEVFNFKTIIFDGSNKSYQVKKWQKECDELGLKPWYTAEDGAFILNIE
ncbi:MAG: competence protein ComEC [Paraglaciecola sp.]|jgi:competence protein ComEC